MLSLQLLPKNSQHLITPTQILISLRNSQHLLIRSRVFIRLRSSQPRQRGLPQSQARVVLLGAGGADRLCSST